MASEKTEQGKNSHLTWWLSIAFLILVGAFLFLRSAYFNVTQYLVTGSSVVSHEEIVARCSQSAANIFAFDLDKAARLIEASPWVERALVRRRLPGTLLISVQERVPVAFVPMDNGSWLVDGQGRVLEEDDGGWPGLVALTGLSGQASPGQFLEESRYGPSFRVLADLGPLSRDKLTEIHVQEGETTLILDDECKVFLGRETPEISQKAVLLESILMDLAQEGSIAEHVDLRFDKPAVKLMQLPAVGGD